MAEKNLGLFEKLRMSLSGADRQFLSAAHRFHFEKGTAPVLDSIMKALDQSKDGREFAHCLHLPFEKIWFDGIGGLPFGHLIYVEDDKLFVITSSEAKGVLKTKKTIELSFDIGAEPFWHIHSGRSPQANKALAYIVMSALVAINQKTYEPALPKLSKSGKTLPAPANEYIITDVHLKIPRTIEVRDDAPFTSPSGDKSTRAQYDVMGFWAMNRKKAMECPQHSWEFEENSKRRMRCTHCQTLSWYVKPHSRGDASKGIMSKDRYLKP